MMLQTDLCWSQVGEDRGRAVKVSIPDWSQDHTLSLDLETERYQGQNCGLHFDLQAKVQDSVDFEAKILALVSVYVSRA